MEAKRLNLGVTGSAPAFPAAEASMWSLVQQYTNRAGYERGAKAPGLAAVPPVIDCSGWVAYLLAEAMRAENAIAGEDIFNVDPAALAAFLQTRDRAGRGVGLVALPGRDGVAQGQHDAVQRRA